MWEDQDLPEADHIQEKPRDEFIVMTKKQLKEYFQGKRTTFDVPLHVEGTPFQQQAWKQLLTIPYGQTISYLEQAQGLGDRKKARAVGSANARNPLPILVPCHRVIATNGKLTGFAGGLDHKKYLIEHELRHS